MEGSKENVRDGEGRNLENEVACEWKVSYVLKIIIYIENIVILCLPIC